MFEKRHLVSKIITFIINLVVYALWRVLYLGFRASQVYNIQVSQEECARLRESVPYVELYKTPISKVERLRR